MTTPAHPGPDAQAWLAEEEAEREFFDPVNAEQARILGEIEESAERTAQENMGIPWADGPTRTYEEMERDDKALAEKLVRRTQPQPEAEAAHVDPAAAARWHQAQSELVGLIRADNRVLDRAPEAERALPDSLGDWMEKRVAELQRPEADEPEIELSD